MNRMLISGHQIDRIHCDHDECLELHRLRSLAIRLNKWDLVNHIEKALTLCPNQRGLIAMAEKLPPLPANVRDQLREIIRARLAARSTK